MIEKLMKKLGIERKQLQNTMREVSEFEANEFMEMALQDVAKLKEGKGTDEEMAVKLYRAYLVGFSLGHHYKKEDK